ncbi:MAG TPA: thiamine-phosphate synthase family protein [Candidatus Poseidoniia archaeon]|jgi:predicted fused transcriptional regulator/phosphomethylpyrimidine kinase/predicted transcriptional regulator|nr:thiamine-phosphate synthase family protein [Candidatus Poseidoniia archaeon]
MMPVELTGNLFKELRGRACRILSEEGWTQANLGRALGVSQVMAGNYLHTLPTHFNEPIESNLQEAAVSLSEILKTGDVSRWVLKIIVDNQELVVNFPVQDTREKILIKIAEMRKRLEDSIPLLSPQVRVNIAIASNDAADSSDIVAFPGRLIPIGGKARSLSSPKFGASTHLSELLLDLRNLGSNALVIINLRWDSIISGLLKNLDVNSAKLSRKGDDLSISETNLEAEALIDEGGYGFEPSLYIIGHSQDRVCKIVEDLAKSMEKMA